VFSLIYHQPLTTITLYICSGFFPWLALSDCVIRGCNSFVANANYLKRLAIPEMVFVAQSATSTALSLALNFALLLLVSLPLGVTPHWTWALLPIPLVLLLCFAFSAGFLLGTLNVFFRDISEWVNIFLQVTFWTVPVVYRIDILPTSVRALMVWHPIAPAIMTVHALFLDGTVPGPDLWISMLVWPAVTFLISTLAFGALRDEMRDLV
jgi:lipopolysaccharide transport system permease protein